MVGSAGLGDYAIGPESGPQSGSVSRATNETVAAPHAVCLIGYGVVGAAVLCAAGMVALVATGPVTVRPLSMTAALLVMATSLVARIPLGPGRALPKYNWGELGIMVGFALVPPAWVAVAAFAGALIAYGPQLAARGAGTRARARFSVASVGLSGVLAVAVVAASGADTGHRLTADAHHLRALISLIVAATVYSVATSVLASAWIAASGDGPLASVLRRVLLNGVPVLLGCLFVGTAGLIVVAVSPWWIAVLVPMLWLLHRSYLSRARLNEDKRIWAGLADATRALHQLDEVGVREATLDGATRLFGPDEVELVLHQEAGTDLVLRAPAEARPTGTVHTRRLVVGDAELGELRLRFRRSVTLDPAEHDAFLAFGDAVASALHDTALHRRLQAMAALSAYEAVHDPLTGLSNRFSLLASGNAELGRLGAERQVGLVVLDVNGFRRINEAMNHAAGDELLRRLGRRLDHLRLGGDLLGRLGGDEFALLITDLGTRPVERAVERAHAIAAALAAPVLVSGVTLAAEVSAGIVVAPAGGADMTELLGRANLALRQARREGASVAVYDGPDDLTTADRLVLLADLRDALATTDQLVLHLQPTVSLHTGLPVGAEAFVYWQHPSRGLLAPAEFFGTIENSDMASGFSRYTVQMALAVSTEWTRAGLELPISVNLCARCTEDPDVPAAIAAQLALYGVSPDRLIVEVSENVIAAERGVVDGVLTGLRAAGVQVSVDDFGTASASLEFLTRFPVDEVKIARSFVAAMGTVPEADAIIHTTVDLARDLGLRVVAAGVERPDQRDALAALGVDAAQGPLFREPMRVPEATAELIRLLGRDG